MQEEKITLPKIRFKSIIIDNVKYKTLLTKKFAKRKSYVEQNPLHMTAFIPGTIIKVAVKQGKKVKMGDSLLILEAMKMMNNVLAPQDSIVKKIHVKAGDKVSKDQLMIELE